MKWKQISHVCFSQKTATNPVLDFLKWKRVVYNKIFIYQLKTICQVLIFAKTSTLLWMIIFSECSACYLLYVVNIHTYSKALLYFHGHTLFWTWMSPWFTGTFPVMLTHPTLSHAPIRCMVKTGYRGFFYC